MAKKATYVVPFRRKREKKTDYKKRLNLLKSGKVRLIVRPSNNHTTVQLVTYNENGDSVISSAHSKELKDFGWELHTGNIPTAYLTGLLCGYRGISKGIKKAILDIGLNPSVKGSRIYSALKGAIDSGIDMPHDEKILPSEERIKGNHISEHRDVKDIEKKFNATKKKISQSPEKKTKKSSKKKTKKKPKKSKKKPKKTKKNTKILKTKKKNGTGK